VFNDTAIMYLLDLFNWGENSDGYIITNDGEYAPSITGKKVHISEIGAIIDKNGEPTIVPDSVSHLWDLE